MTKTFEGRIRRVGNSVGVIIPNEILKESGAREGDKIGVALVIPEHHRRKVLERIAGIDQGASGFARDKRSRI